MALLAALVAAATLPGFTPFANGPDGGAVLMWSGYFHPLRDGPFRYDTNAQLRTNDPRALALSEGVVLREDGTRFFLSSGPYHSHWFKPVETRTFAATLRQLGLPVRTLFTPSLKGEWRTQFDAGLTWALKRLSHNEA
jgi:hypothetical protein